MALDSRSQETPAFTPLDNQQAIQEITLKLESDKRDEVQSTTLNWLKKTVLCGNDRVYQTTTDRLFS